MPSKPKQPAREWTPLEHLAIDLDMAAEDLEDPRSETRRWTFEDWLADECGFVHLLDNERPQLLEASDYLMNLYKGTEVIGTLAYEWGLVAELLRDLDLILGLHADATYSMDKAPELAPRAVTHLRRLAESIRRLGRLADAGDRVDRAAAFVRERFAATAEPVGVKEIAKQLGMVHGTFENTVCRELRRRGFHTAPGCYGGLLPPEAPRRRPKRPPTP
jgi:hypothetical protein